MNMQVNSIYRLCKRNLFYTQTNDIYVCKYVIIMLLIKMKKKKHRKAIICRYVTHIIVENVKFKIIDR